MHVKCETCGEKFTPRGKGRFCSRDCYHASMGKMCQCETCGKEFKVKKRDKGRFCSRQCHYDSKGIEVACLQCGEKFKIHPCQVDKVRYCSNACWGISKLPYCNSQGQQVKVCTQCQKEKTIDEFYPRKALKSGLESWCKRCCADKSLVYQQTSQAKKKRKKYNRTTTRRFHVGKHSAKRRGYEWLITKEEYQRLIEMPCHYCGQPLDQAGSGLDRKDNGKVYSIDTVVSCCGRCNMTFMNNFNYNERLLLAETIKEIDRQRFQKF